MILETLAVGPLMCNCSIVADDASREAIVIDPGGDPERILEVIRRRDLKVRGIIHTHTHIDHVGATSEVQEATGAPARVHDKDMFLYRMLPVQAGLVGVSVPRTAQFDRPLDEGEVVRAGSLDVAVLHTPGHTPGSLSFVLGNVVFTGDTLFAGSIGRTDLWGGDFDAIVASIRGKLLTLPEDTIVVAGHGPPSTIGDEARVNPFVGRTAR